MIPTLILFGLLAGRWWRSTLVIAAVGWPALILIAGNQLSWPTLLTAALLALVNTAAGTTLHQAILHLIRRTKAPTKPPQP